MTPQSNEDLELSVYADWLEDEGRSLESQWVRESLIESPRKWECQYGWRVGGGGVDSPCVFDVVSDESDDDDFTRDLPLNMSDDEVKGLLFAYPAEPLAYDDWLKVGQALHHQYKGGGFGQDCKDC